MKLATLILYFSFLLIQNDSYVFAQRVISPYISFPDNPRKADVIMIYSLTRLEYYYYKSKNDEYYLGVDSTFDSYSNIVWKKTYYSPNDSIRLPDIFDNLEIDNPANFRDQYSGCFGCMRAVYFRQRKIMFSKKYKTKLKKVVVEYW